MYPGDAAAIGVDKPAVVMAGSGETVTWGQLDAGSNRLAQFWRAQGLRPGDHVALLMENHPRFFEVAWAAVRSGLYITAINSHLTASEVGYVLDDCEARSLVTTAAKVDIATAALPDAPRVETRLLIDTTATGFDDYTSAVGAQPQTPVDDETLGAAMLYSSGTTGRPKGIFRPLTGQHPHEEAGVALAVRYLYGGHLDMRYLSPAPLYHAAPMGFTMGTHGLGGTVYVMERFDPAEAIDCIERFRITHSQWVPTMFGRMLKLPEAQRTNRDLSSHVCAIHAAAPCPVPVKKAMIDWWGPILREYYAGTEGNGATGITSEEWLAHPGSVGKPTGAVIHILDDEGTELPSGQSGAIWFESPTATSYEYFHDAEKTAGSRNTSGWSTLGDVGYLDDEGYLYLTDRKAYMIIVGGANVYPQETENILSMHPKVADVAVFGVPDDDMGEAVKAVVQPMPGVAGDPALAAQLIAYCKQQLATIKCPKSVDFLDELPRLPTGKLYKRLLRDKYWEGRDAKV